MENIIQKYLLNELSAQEKADFQAEMKKNTDLRLAVQAARALMLARKLGNEMPTYEERQPLDKNSAEYHQAKSQLLKLVAKPMEEEIKRKRFFLSEIPKYYFSAASNFFIIDKNSEADIKAKFLGVVTDSTEEKTKKIRRPLWQNTRAWFAAASILLLVGLGIWWFSPQKPQIKAEWIANPQPKELPKERQVADETACLNTYNQSINLLHKGQYQQAKEKLLAYKAFCDGDIDYRFLLGLSYFHLPDSTKEAANIWKNMDNGLADDRQTAKIKWHLALVSYKMDDKINCQKYLMELKDLPDSLTHIYPISELNQQLSK